MAFRIATYWKPMLDRLGGRPNFATATSPKMKVYNPAADHGHVYDAKPRHEPKAVRGDFVPVYVAMGMIALSMSLGLYTAMHQLKRSPNVQVKKSRRETIPEVVDPDVIVGEGEKFIKNSLFRNVAHVQDRSENPVPDHIRGEALGRPVRAVTLKTVGVDPKEQ